MSSLSNSPPFSTPSIATISSPLPSVVTTVSSSLCTDDDEDGAPVIRGIEQKLSSSSTSSPSSSPSSSPPPPSKVVVYPSSIPSNCRYSALRASRLGRVTENYVVLDGGDRYIASSLRNDGTLRRQIKMRPGYVPMEEREKFRSRITESPEEGSKMEAREWESSSFALEERCPKVWKKKITNGCGEEGGGSEY